LRNEITTDDELTVDDLLELHADLVARGVPAFPEFGGTYVFILDSYAKLSLMKDSKFFNFITSSTVDPQRRAELNRLGTFLGFTFFETNNPIIFAGAGYGGINVRCSVALGRNAYGISEWQDPKLIPKGLGSAGSADPVDQLATLGWKGAWATIVLQDLFIERIEHR
jgi:N4-gp56 family major capsid protein